MLEFSKKIKELRKLRNLTQDQLAKRLQVTKSTISAYESNTRFPSLDMLVKISKTFNITTDYLLGVNKKQYLDISDLNKRQTEIIKQTVEEFKKNILP